MRIAQVSTFPPIPCGIASFASDVIMAMPGVEHVSYALHYGDHRSASSAGNADVNSPASVVPLTEVQFVSRLRSDLLIRDDIHDGGDLDDSRLSRHRTREPRLQNT